MALPKSIGREADSRRIALIVQGAAAQITRSLAVREKTLLDTYLAEVRKRGSDPVVVMDDRTTIATRAVLRRMPALVLGESGHWQRHACRGDGA